MQSPKSYRIRRIVDLRHALLKWRLKSATRSKPTAPPPDVPSGHVAIYVASRRRFVVRTSYLNHPIFQQLLSEAEEEYGFDIDGPITIPCDEQFFEQVLKFVGRSGSDPNFARCGYFGAEARPLLGGEKSVW